MKLVLMSAYNTDEITKEIEKLVGKTADKINIAIISEAVGGDSWDIREWLIDSLVNMRSSFGGEFYWCNLVSVDIKETEKTINKADIIWVLGGHVSFLKGIFDQTGFSKILPKLLESKVWVGSSAGSCVIGKKPFINPDYDNKYKVENWLELVNLIIEPHVWAPHEHGTPYEMCVEESLKSRDIPVYALSDYSAVIVENEKIYLVGENAHEIVNGKVTNEV